MNASSPLLAILILAAGKGTRMKSALPKVLHKIAGTALISHVLQAAAKLKPASTIVVIGPHMPKLAVAVAPATSVVQEQQKGTGDAVRAAKALLPGQGTILILAGDVPLVTHQTLEKLIAAQQGAPDIAIALTAFHATDPTGYGRVCLAGDRVVKIVEERDASPDEKAITLANGGVYAIDAASLLGWIDQLEANNAQGEYYLTDLVALAVQAGCRVVKIDVPAEEMQGVNSRQDLALAEALLQKRLRAAALANGVTMIDPATVYLCSDTVLSRDVIIAPQVYFGPGVVIGDGVEIRSFSHLEGCRIDAGAIIGPFARIRPGSTIAAGAHVGNFVELKNSALGEGAKASHLTYLGDSEIGAGSNIGAGTITCNYDGFVKSRTIIGNGVFVGSNATLVAPLSIGAGAFIAAGSTITATIPADAMAFSRVKQNNRDGAAQRYRDKRQKEIT